VCRSGCNVAIATTIATSSQLTLTIAIPPARSGPSRDRFTETGPPKKGTPANAEKTKRAARTLSVYWAALKADFLNSRCLRMSSARLATTWVRTANPTPPTETRAKMNGAEVEVVSAGPEALDMTRGLTSPTKAATPRNAIGHNAARVRGAAHSVLAIAATKPTAPKQETAAM